MRRRKVRFTLTARAHVQRERSWWIENRDHVELFAEELADALEIIARLPGAGRPYPNAGIRGVRRLYLSKLGCHIYYTFDSNEVTVRALWGARRELGPQL